MSERPPRIREEELVLREIAVAALQEREINDAAASTIARWFSSAQATALKRFSTTGAIERLRIENEYVTAYNRPDMSYSDRLALDYFGTYLLHADGLDEAGNRGPVEDWDERSRWEES